MNYVDIQAVESQLVDVTVTAVPLGVRTSSGYSSLPFANQQFTELHQMQNRCQLPSTALSTVPVLVNKSTYDPNTNVSKYSQLLMILEEMGRDIRPTYSGSRSSTERLKRGIVHARILIRECLLEAEIRPGGN